MSFAESNQGVPKASIFQWLLPAFWIFVGSGFYFGATRITTAIVQDKHDPGPAAICLLSAVALILLGITQAVQLVITKPNFAPTNSASKFDTSQHATKTSKQSIAFIQSTLGVCVIAFYIFAVFSIGFGLATLFFGIVSMKSLGASWRTAFLATATCMAIVYLVFIELLGILLPTGHWDMPF